jgi:enoyl-CoA hydratase
MPVVSYHLDGSVATITMDDGKVNALSPTMQNEINAAFDCAEADRAVVVLSGRDGVFSAGFDLGVLRAGGQDAATMVKGGFELAYRMLSFPTPVVVACTGHAIAMGVFLLLSGDHLVGADGPYKLMANEVAIGLTLPRAAIEILKHRIAPAHFNRAANLAATFTPANAVEAGFLDEVVEPSKVLSVSKERAVALSSLDMVAHAATKRRVREQTLNGIREDVAAQDVAFRDPQS